MRLPPVAIGLCVALLPLSLGAQSPAKELSEAAPAQRPDAVAAAVAEPGSAGFELKLRLDPELHDPGPARGQPRPLFGRGDQLDGREARDFTLRGEAELRRGGTVIRADRLTYYEADDEVIAIGNVRIAREGQVFTGPQLQLKLDAGTGGFDSPRFSLPLTGGRGSASRIDFKGDGQVDMSDAVYTSCRPDDPDWYLKAGTLSLDEASDEGVGKSARLVFMGVPILGSPVFSFPLGEQRRSGVLAPTLSLTSTTGGEIRVPYYWDIAPNRDFTFLPMLMARRGLQLGGIARYLEPTYYGETSFEYLNNDRETGTDRWQVNSTHTLTNWNGWSAGWLLRAVSDDNYFVDFSRTILSSAERSLPRIAYAARSFGEWSFQARALQYQNILDARAAPPYNRLPQLLLSTVRRDQLGFDYGLLSDASWFSRDLPGSPEGGRFVVNPWVSRPFGGPGWFVVPRASFNATYYRLDFNPSGPNDINRTLPTFSLDSGLVMERSTRFRERELIQTLEPRLFYVYTPYKDQNQIPVFDSAQNDLNFSTLFTENIFSGGDRIANANQLTPGVVSRLIDPDTGAEWLRMGVAQRLYFEPQLVTLPGVPSRTASRSDVILAASGDVGGGHSFDAGMTFSLNPADVPRLNAAWRWWPSDVRLLNLAARYRALDYAQIDLSWRWPVARRWSALGRINYSVLRKQLNTTTGAIQEVDPELLEGVAGFEYSADCWITRFVVQRFVTAQGQQTTGFFVQLELSGLARIGLDPLDILRRSIPGYRIPSQRPAPPSRFYGYE